MSSLGELLKAARQEKGFTLENVEEAIRIRVHLLEAMESNSFSVFPSPAIARGLIRNYAKFLGIDPIEALTLYDGKGIMPVKGQRVTDSGVEFKDLSMAPKPIPWDIMLVSVVIATVFGAFSVFIYRQFWQTDNLTTIFALEPTAETIDPVDLEIDQAFELDTPTPLPTNTPTPVPPTSTPTPIVYRGVTVELILREESWIQILVDNIKQFEGIMQAGDGNSWSGENQVSIRAGNAGGVEVIVNGINRGLMGESGKVREQLWRKVEDAAVPPIQPTAPPNINETPSP